MKTLRSVLALTGLFCTLTAGAADKPAVPIVVLAELSGGGASVGATYRNGIELAFKEINAAGGILGRKVDIQVLDTQTTPGVAKALAQKAVDSEAYVVMGPVFSSSIVVSMKETQRAEIPNFMAGDANTLTQQGNPYVFRGGLPQSASMPKLARYIAETMKAKSVGIVWVNNDFGRGGRDAMSKALEAKGVKIAADVVTDPNQVDFTAAVLKLRQADPDVAFVYLHEEESARVLRELRKQGWTKPLVGESTLGSQKVIDLAGDLANGVISHVALTGDSPIPAVNAFSGKYLKAYGSKSDANGIKGYMSAYVVKAVTEKIGKFDSKLFAKTLHGMKISAKDYPGVLMDVSYDANGDPDRESFMVRVSGGKQEVFATLPPLGAK